MRASRREPLRTSDCCAVVRRRAAWVGAGRGGGREGRRQGGRERGREMRLGRREGVCFCLRKCGCCTMAGRRQVLGCWMMSGHEVWRSRRVGGEAGDYRTSRFQARRSSGPSTLCPHGAVKNVFRSFG